MENKVNYQKELEKTLQKIKESGTKPTLLLHACCGPCFTLPHEEIKDYFKITVIYNNSNIYPEEEYCRRLNELKKYLKEISADIEVIEFPYDNLNYNKDLEPYADMPEGMERCRICFQKRLGFGYSYAEEHGFDYFGTVMTISRYKNSQVINQIGYELEKQHKHTKWLPADFKKNDGYNKSLKIVREHEMYFQEYCGCKYSYQKMKEKHGE
ncbi:MAG: epoxyqueuosine reductase QueH [Bacilli bacterium]|nr:epoxyqueuosine reductase QueH [Bacilli bacterium]